jgi:MtN3 and saliva related transmembrane protein
MSFAFAQGVSILAPIANCIQMIPQLYKSYKTQKVHDLSIYSLSLLLLTSVLWLLHGYFIQDASLIVAGVISVAVNAMMFTLFFKYSRTRT